MTTLYVQSSTLLYPPRILGLPPHLGAIIIHHSEIDGVPRMSWQYMKYECPLQRLTHQRHSLCWLSTVSLRQSPPAIIRCSRQTESFAMAVIVSNGWICATSYAQRCWPIHCSEARRYTGCREYVLTTFSQSGRSVALELLRYNATLTPTAARSS